MRTLGKTPIRAAWKMASMWRRYKGRDSGQPGGIDVYPEDACEMSMIMPAVRGGEDVLAKRRPGRLVRNEFAMFFNKPKPWEA